MIDLLTKSVCSNVRKANVILIPFRLVAAQADLLSGLVAAVTPMGHLQTRDAQHAQHAQQPARDPQCAQRAQRAQQQPQGHHPQQHSSADVAASLRQPALERQIPALEQHRSANTAPSEQQRQQDSQNNRQPALERQRPALEQKFTQKPSRQPAQAKHSRAPLLIHSAPGQAAAQRVHQLLSCSLSDAATQVTPLITILMLSLLISNPNAVKPLFPMDLGSRKIALAIMV